MIRQGVIIDGAFGASFLKRTAVASFLGDRRVVLRIEGAGASTGTSHRDDEQHDHHKEGNFFTEVSLPHASNPDWRVVPVVMIIV